MKQKRRLIKIIISAILFILGMILPLPSYAQLTFWGLSYFLVGWEIIAKAAKNIVYGQVFDENFLMTVATLGAIGLGEYSEAVAVMLFYQIGEYFQKYAVAKSRKSISSLMNIRPDYANLCDGEQTRQVSPEEVNVGDYILVKPGEKIPLDGKVIEGTSSLDTSSLTGESLPREVEKDSDVLSGCINLTGVLKIQVSKEYGESTVAKILDLVENAASNKAKVEQFITKFARWYTPIVVLSALIIAVIPPLIMADATFSSWIYRALTFLVISCPCALVISVPLSFFGGIGAASKQGILVKGSNYLQALSETEVVVFDKTGTLTKGTFSVVKVEGNDFPTSEVLELAAYADAYSNHPISQSIRQAYARPIDTSRISNYQEIAGRGVCAEINGVLVHLGNTRLMTNLGTQSHAGDGDGTIINLAVDGKYKGWIKISDEVKLDSAQAISALKSANVHKTVMLTGDNKASGEKIAKQLGLDKVYCELLPTQKVEKLEELLAAKTPNKNVVFVGDGINDAPVLARADIGIAMGKLGSDAAIEAADVVIMTDEPLKIASAIKISRKTLRIVRQNIVFALAIKGLVLLLGVMGMATMWEAVFADVGVSVLAILNSLRALSVKK